MERARDLAVEESGGEVEAGGDGGGLHYSGDEGEGGSDKDGSKVGEELQAVVLEPATGWWEIEGEILDGGGDGVGDDIERNGNDASPLACGKKKNIDGDSVGKPGSIKNEVPPASEADGVANSRQAQPAWEGDGIFFGVVFAVERNWAKESKPL